MALWDWLQTPAANSILSSLTLLLVALCVLILSRRRQGPR